jgi:hypothetical protein
MVEVGESVRQHLLRNKNMSCGKMDLEQKFNTATALLYTGQRFDTGLQGIKYWVGFHCDTIWNALAQSFSYLAVLYKLQTIILYQYGYPIC